MTLKTAVSNMLLREASEEEVNDFALEEQEAVYDYLRYEASRLNKRCRTSKAQQQNPLMEQLEAYNDELIDYDDILFDPIMSQYFN